MVKQLLKIFNKYLMLINNNVYKMKLRIERWLSRMKMSSVGIKPDEMWELSPHQFILLISLSKILGLYLFVPGLA